MSQVAILGAIIIVVLVIRALLEVMDQGSGPLRH